MGSDCISSLSLLIVLLFIKAYDLVNREILWTKLEKFGLNRQLLYGIKSLYNNVLCSVELIGFT